MNPSAPAPAPAHSTPVVTRFAPSPTGHLHIGGARTALFCWAYARAHAGTFILRIEDTDQARSSEASARGILEDLAWLGIDWDEGPRLDRPASETLHARSSPRTLGGDPRGVGPFFQAQRLPIYNAAIDRLLAAGRAYPAFETPDELEARRRAAVAAKQTYRYQRPDDVAPGRVSAARLDRLARGEPHVIRLVAPEGEIVVRDRVLGDVRYAPGEVDDFVLRKADGFPTYHFAVVVDDELMGVTHVLRGQEHLMNTPRHVALQRALTRPDSGAPFRTPEYAHMPLIFNMDGTKMSKRDKDKAARAACKSRALTALPADLITDPPVDFAAWLADTQRQLPADLLRRLADRVQVNLPEVEVEDFRRAGYLPETIVNFLALLGWSPGEKLPDGRDLERFDAAYLARSFSIERIGQTNARFDRVKLLAFNAEAINAMSDEAFLTRWRAWCAHAAPGLPERFEPAVMPWLLRAIRPRCKTLRDSVALCQLWLGDDASFPYDEKAAAKALRDTGPASASSPATQTTPATQSTPPGLDALRAVRAALESLHAFEPEPLDQLLESIAHHRATGLGQVAQPVRVALCGSGVSPPLGLTMAIFGRQRTLARLDRSIRHFAP